LISSIPSPTFERLPRRALFAHAYGLAYVVAVIAAVAPALLVAQAIGRIGNYFNQELFDGPTNLPWALESIRRTGRPATSSSRRFSRRSYTPAAARSVN
jgi:prolipoprotein diacylglyceryltransferase